ncbi:DUF3592 domain-containing protein [Streptomyces sp. NPDC006553]|uniref:DUF3592 domain-containing protein n=1 Tax=Streptomyces sp. NPDC006553 TaxID=3157180 RepID=UPI0033A704F8
MTARSRHEELRIPLAAIEVVRAEGRNVAIEMTAPDGTDAAVYRVDDVNEATATAFADAVNSLLPEPDPDAPRIEGWSLVTNHILSTSAPAPFLRSRRALAIGLVAVPALALDVFLGVAGRFEYALMFWLSLLVVAIGGFLVFTMARDLYRMWHLPRTGITVTARFSHYTNRTRVYEYRDTTGAAHTYDNNVGGQYVELSYDPRDPKAAIHTEGLYVRGMMTLMTLVGCGLAGGGLFGIGWLVAETLRRRPSGGRLVRWIRARTVDRPFTRSQPASTITPCRSCPPLPPSEAPRAPACASRVRRCCFAAPARSCTSR